MRLSRWSTCPIVTSQPDVEVNVDSAPALVRQPPRTPIVGAAALAIVLLLGGGSWLYHQEAERIRGEAKAALEVIATVKAEQLSSWRTERLSDARVLAGTILEQQAPTVLRRVPSDPTATEAIARHLELSRNAYGYTLGLLALPDGGVLLTTDGQRRELSETERRLVRSVVNERRAIMSGVFAADSGATALSTISPVFDLQHRVIAEFVLRVDPEIVVFPLLDNWPTPTETGETLLLTRDGERVVFINHPRAWHGPPLGLELPLGADRVEARAVRNPNVGALEGRDYRGHAVLASTLPVKGTDWVLVTKQDQSEIQNRIMVRGLEILSLVLLGILLTTALIFALFNLRTRYLYQGMFRAERARREAENEANAALYSIADAVITTDASGVVRRLNPVAADLTSWSESDAAGQPIDRVIWVLAEDTRQTVVNPVIRLLGHGEHEPEQRNMLLVGRDGRETPITATVAPILDETGNLGGVVLVCRDQSEERQAQRRLERDAQRRRVLFKQARDGIVLLRDGKVLEANRSFADMIGWPLEDVSRLEIADWDTRFSDMEQYRTSMALNPSVSDISEARFRRRDGSFIHVEITSSSVEWDEQPVLFCICRDISERKRTDDALRQSEQQFREFVEFLPLLAWTAQSDGATFFYNKRWSEFTGQAMPSKPDSSWNPPLHPDDRPRVVQEWQKAKASGCDFTCEYRVRRHDGVYHWFLSRGVPLRDEQGNIFRWVGTSVDIDEMKQAEAVLETKIVERTHDLQLARDEARAASRVKDVFLATMSHELRTPLNSIIGFSDLILAGLTGPITDEQRLQLGLINRSGHQLLELISDVLDISKVEAGHLNINIGPLPMRELLQDKFRAFRLQAEDHGLHLTCDIDAADVTVLGDGRRVRQILANLLSNAIKYSDRGQITLRALRSSDALRIEVQDQGIGIAARDLPQLFTPFHRIDGDGSRVREGTGLGLAIAKRLVESMNGTLGVESQPGVGSTFWFTLPLAPDTGNAVADSALATAAERARGGACLAP